MEALVFLRTLLSNATNAIGTLDANTLQNLDLATIQNYLPIDPKTLASYAASLTALAARLGPAAKSLMSADLVSLLLLLLGVLLAFQVIDYVRRLVMFWVWLAVKIVVLLCVVQVGVYAYAVGTEGCLRDLGFIWGWVLGAVDGVTTGSGTGKGGKRYGGNHKSGRWT